MAQEAAAHRPPGRRVTPLLSLILVTLCSALLATECSAQPGAAEAGQGSHLPHPTKTHAAEAVQHAKAESKGASAASLDASAAASLLRSARGRYPDGYVALCVVVKDQPRDLRYWIAYHRWVGVDKFYIFDHNSTRPMLPVLMDWAREGVVEYQYFVGRPRRLPSFTDSNQWRGYHNCIKQHASRHAWLGMMDADEFVVFQPGAGPRHSLPLLLAGLEGQRAGALALHWVVFGSSGHRARPRGGPLASYTACIPPSHPESTHVKIIAHTGSLVDMGPTPHEVVLKPGAAVVDADGRPSGAPKSDTARWGRVVLHHYVLKSRAEFEAKTARGSGAGNVKTAAYWDYIEPLATQTCTRGLNVSAAFLDSKPRLRMPRTGRGGGGSEAAAAAAAHGSTPARR